MIPPDETARVYYPGNHGGAMWQPPAYSPITHYFYTMGINEPHIYKVKRQQALGAGHAGGGPAVRQCRSYQDQERKAPQSQMIPAVGQSLRD